jgi:hypothetical protein
MSQVPFPSRTARVGSLLAVSGGGASTVFSGTGVLLGVIAFPLSGSAATASFSGVGDLLVQDAASGMFTLGSGAAVLYRYDFGTQSGFGLNAPNLNLLQLPYVEAFVNSGLVAKTVSGWGLTVVFSK